MLVAVLASWSADPSTTVRAWLPLQIGSWCSPLTDGFACGRAVLGVTIAQCHGAACLAWVFAVSLVLLAVVTCWPFVALDKYTAHLAVPFLLRLRNVSAWAFRQACCRAVLLGCSSSGVERGVAGDACPLD